MASDVTPIERLQEQPMIVDPAAIEAEFARVWRETSGGGYDTSSVRLRMLNFVALGLDPRALDRFEEVMQVLPQRHPCRGILAHAPAGQRQLEASISAHCWRSASGSRHVCSEEVVLRGVPGQEEAMASAVRALLVPELPVVCWLTGPPGAASELSGDVLEGADSVFFDSRDAPDPAAALRWARDTADAYDVHPCDLAWGRLATWRALVAQAFDGVDRTAELGRINAIDVEGGHERPSSESLLLAGWMVSRLALTPASVDVSSDRLKATLYDGTRPVSLSVAAGDTAPVQQFSVRSQTLTLTIDQHAESGHMHLQEEWGGEAPVRRTVDKLSDDDPLVIARMLDDGPDAVYLEALDAALGLLGA